MALPKTTVSFNFRKGIDTKTDPFQVQLGSFLVLENSIFDKALRLTKRNGFGSLTSLPPGPDYSFLTTFKENLLAIAESASGKVIIGNQTFGSTLEVYSTSNGTWNSGGIMQPLKLSVLPVIRNPLNQTQLDTAVSPNGLLCTAYTETDGTTTYYKYTVSDSVTGQILVGPTAILPSSGVVSGSPRVFVLGKYFIIGFTATIAAVKHLQYIAINTNTFSVTTAVDIIASYASATTVSWDGLVVNNNLYVAWSAVAAGGIKMTYIDATLTQHNTTNPDASHQATLMSLTADTSGPTPIIWVTYYNLGATTGYSFAVNQQLNVVLAATLVIPAGTILNLTSSADNGVNTFFYEVSNNYGYDSAIPTHYVQTNSITQAGVLGTAVASIRSLGLASKAFRCQDTIFYVGIYFSAYQPTYFLINGSRSISIAPFASAKLAYSNGGGYLTLGLPNVQVNDLSFQFGYLIKDLVTAVAKTTPLPTGTQTAGVYSQTGINQSTMSLGTEGMSTAEIGNDLHLTGGYLWMYDGVLPTEHNFFLYPDSIEATWSTTGGHVLALPDGSTTTNAYWYQVVYAWTDNQGNTFRSSPSIPIPVTTSGSGTTGSIVVHIPTLRVTNKTNVKIEVYRWSVGQTTYYQTTSIFTPLLNDPSIDAVTFTDINADTPAQNATFNILGNNILYTTGGVLEDTNAPAFTAITLFNSRLFGIDSEDENLLWISQPVIEATPVEMSLEQTYFVPPTQGAKGSTGPMKCLAPMDDKLIIFKPTGINYLTGQGPDATGNNSDFPLSPTFVTSTVGSLNQNSIVFTPLGLMFEFGSEVGNQIWLLGRDLSTQYIGAPVEGLTLNDTVLSAVSIPGTNQVRFTMQSGITLMYDHFFGQWGTFTGIPGISSTLFQGKQSFINSLGEAFQETPGVYLDGSNPTLMKFQTSWIATGGIQGYQRAFWAFLLGEYLSPHKLVIGISYDFNQAVVQQPVIIPGNYSPAFGGDATFGVGSPPSSPFGGPADTEQWQINFKKQTCTSFQLTVSELYDPTIGPAAGAGLTLSGIDLVVGAKKTYPRNLPASRKIG